MGNLATLVQAAPQSSFEERLKLLATWAGIAYALGFVCILVHTARYGIQVIEVIKPLNFWVGFPPTAVILLSGYLWERYLSTLARKAEEKRIALIKKGVPIPTIPTISQAVAMAKKARNIANFALNLAALLVAAVALYSVVAGKFASSGWLWSFLQVAAYVIFVAIVLPLAVQATSLLRLWFEKYNWLRMVFLPMATGAVILYYFWSVYPFVPQPLGGGWPSKVQLVLDAASLKDSPLVGLGVIKMQGSASTTGDVCLLYKTAEAYFIDFRCSVASPGQPSIISIPEKTVQAVLWKGRPDYRKIPWFMPALRQSQRH